MALVVFMTSSSINGCTGRAIEEKNDVDTHLTLPPKNLRSVQLR